MDYGLGFLGEYITAAELVGKMPTLTINKVTLEKVESLKEKDEEGGGKMKDKIIIYFAESKSGRGWLLNRTNAEAIKELWGRETEGWLGHRITLFTLQVKVGKKMEPGIRVKGSPELTAPRSFELKLPRKKAITVTLLPTAKPAGNGADQKEPPEHQKRIEALIAAKGFDVENIKAYCQAHFNKTDFSLLTPAESTDLEEALEQMGREAEQTL